MKDHLKHELGGMRQSSFNVDRWGGSKMKMLPARLWWSTESNRMHRNDGNDKMIPTIDSTFYVLGAVQIL